MPFEFNQEQLQLADAIKRWVGRDYTFETRRAIVRSPAGVSDAAWATIAELGLTALPVPEEHGGFGGDALDLFVVMRELGRGLVVEPYLATALGAEFLRLGGAHGALLERVAGGTLKLACALGERAARHDPFEIATRAEPLGDGRFRLHGAKTAVPHGAEADLLVVSARLDDGVRQRRSDDVRDGDGVALFALPAASPGLGITGYRTVDGQRAAGIVLDGVEAGPEAALGRPGAAGALLDAGCDHGVGLLCAEALGAMEALFEATLDYLKTRRQFGAPIGGFQALQHRMADMAIHLEQARSLALLAALTLARTRAGPDRVAVASRRRAVSAAKYRVGQAARFIGQNAVQLHGGMGVTDELPVSHYFKRLSAIELTLGDAGHHLERFIAQPGFREDDAAPAAVGAEAEAEAGVRAGAAA